MPDSSPRRPASSMRGLLIINAALLAVLAAVTFGPTAIGQQRVEGEYTMVAGGAIGLNSSIVYVVDVRNRELLAVTYDHNNKKLDGIGYRNISTDTQTVLRRGN